MQVSWNMSHERSTTGFLVILVHFSRTYPINAVWIVKNPVRFEKKQFVRWQFSWMVWISRCELFGRNRTIWLPKISRSRFLAGPDLKSNGSNVLADSKLFDLDFDQLKGDYDATKYRSNCPNGFGNDYSKEDCLFLNMLVPDSLQVDEKRPVMIWIHGGAFLTGSGAGNDVPANQVRYQNNN